MTKTFLIFTGHNDRAVVALCRALSARNLALRLIANSESDLILKTTWASRILWTRGDGQVNLSLFERIRRSVPLEERLIYCPTTEFINSFVLEHREALELMGIEVMLPSAQVYSQLTNKSQSTYLVNEVCGLRTPSRISWIAAEAPCVFKPNSNVLDGAVHYPILCFSESEVTAAQTHLDPSQWFVQKYIHGQSHYLCGYLSRNGDFRSYWQTNLIQQPNGKSIVLARSTSNPGMNEGRFFSGLAKMGYYGPIMMEVIGDADGQLNFIEINPRFWGPLQLGVDACPEMFDLYARDAGFDVSVDVSKRGRDTKTFWYAWSEGARMHSCRIYPAAEGFSNEELRELLHDHDVYRRDDTRGLQERHLRHNKNEIVRRSCQ